MAPNESQVLVRLRLLGADLMARDARKASGGLKDIDKASRQTSRGLSSINGGRVQGQMGLIERGTLKAKGGLKGLHAQAIEVGRVLKTVGGAAGVLAATGLAAGIKSSVNFEQAMANVHAKLIGEKGLSTAMPALSKLALDLGAKTQFSASEAAGAMNELAAQGFSVKQIMGVLPGTLSLAAASGADLATAAAIQTETLHGFGLAAGEAGRVADVLAQTSNRSAADITDLQESIKYIAPVAKASGQTLEDMMSAVGLMSNVGIKGSQAGTTLRTAMVRLSAPTKKARGALADLGLKAGDLAGKKGLLSMPNILGKFVKGAQGVSKNTRNAALAAIFGREALSGMVALVEKGPKKFNAMSDSLEHSRGAAKKAADVMRGTVKGAWDNFTGSVESASISLLRKFNPTLKDSLNKASGLVDKATPKIAGFFKGLSTGAQTRVVREPGGPARQEAVPMSGTAKAGADLRAKLAPIFGWIKSQLPGVGKLFMSVGKQLLDAFKPAMPFLKNVLLPLLEGIGAGVLSSVVGAFKVAVPIIKIVATVLGAIGKAAAPIRPVIQGVGFVIGAMASGPILKLLGGVGKIGVVFRLARAPIRIVEVAFGGLVRVLAGLGGAFLRTFTFASRFAGTLQGGVGRGVRAALNLVGGVIHAVESMPGKAAGIGSRLVSKISGGVRSRLSSLVSFFKRIGGVVVQGIVDGIKSLPGKVGDAVLGLIPGKAKGLVGGALGLVGVGKNAKGGRVRSPLQLVGEHGPELAALPMGSQVVTASDTRRMLRPQPNSVPATAMLPTPTGGQLLAHLVVNLDGREVHRGVHRVERAKQEAS